jgi:hypothetical protein
MKLILSIAFLTLLTLVPGAQVPVDDGVRFSFGSPIGIEVIDVAGVIPPVPITGVSAAYQENNAGALDPLTGELWTGGINVSPGEIARHTLGGLVAVSTVSVATLPAGNVKAMDFDWNGDLFACSQYNVYKVDRGTGALTVWDVDTYDGMFNALCVDAEENRMYVATWNVVLEYDLAAGPGSGKLIHDNTLAGPAGTISGLDDAADGLLWITCLDVTTSIYSLDPATGALGYVGAPLSAGLNDVWVSRRDGSLHVVGPGGDDDYYTIDPTTGAWTQVTIGSSVGVPSSVALNDFLDRTEVAPLHPSASGSDFTLETSAHGMPGELAITGIVSVNGIYVLPILLGTGSFDSGGCAWFQTPVTASWLTAGDRFGILSARVDPLTGQVTLGSEVEIVVEL